MGECGTHARWTLVRLVGAAICAVVFLGCGNSGEVGNPTVRYDVVPAADVRNLIEEPGSVLGLVTERVDPGAGSTISPLAGTMDLTVVSPTPEGMRVVLKISKLELKTVEPDPDLPGIVISGNSGVISVPASEGVGAAVGEIPVTILDKEVTLRVEDSSLYPGPPVSNDKIPRFQGLALRGDLSAVSEVTLVIVANPEAGS